MSWGTDFTTDIFLSHLTFQSTEMLRDTIADKEKDLADYTSQIKMWASSTPKDVFTTTENEPLISAISFEVDQILAEYKETVLSLKDLYRYLDYVEENNIDLTKPHETD